MEERKTIIKKFVSLGMRVAKAASIAGIGKSTYYYKPNNKLKGKKPSNITIKNNKVVDNSVLLKDMQEILAEEFNDYGYIRITMALRALGYYINPKKVYRIMKENNWLFPKKRKTILNKKYVKFTTPLTDFPFQVIETDIKYIHISGTKRNAYLITLLDTFSRNAAEWVLEYNMKAQRVMELISALKKNECIQNVSFISIRTDNGSQFIAKAFRKLLEDNQMPHEYIHPGTPQENGHIESFHSTVEKNICKRYEFDSLEHAKETFKRFFDYYNNDRIMKSILYLSPNNFLKLWYEKKIGIKREKKKQKFFFKEKLCNNNIAPPFEEIFNFAY